MDEQLNDTLNGGIGNDEVINEPLGESQDAEPIPAISSTEQADTTDVTAEGADESEPQTLNESESPSDPANDDAFIDALAAKLTEADSTRFENLTNQFARGEAFSPEDVQWIGEITGHDETSVRYVLSLQREAYRVQQKDVQSAVADAEAEVGSLDELLNYARVNATPEQNKTWQTIADFAARTGDDAMTMNLLREMKAFKDAQPVTSGGKPKTLGHLVSATNSNNETPKEAAVPVPEPEVTVDPLAQQMARLNNQALARIVQTPNGDPKTVSLALVELKARGIV